MKIKLIDQDENIKVTDAVRMANELLTGDVLYARIRSKEKFELSTATPMEIADLMEASNLEFMVDFFYPSGWRRIKYAKTLAYTDHQYPNTLFLNLRKLKRSSEQIASTIIHESIHALDHSSDFTFGHGNNSSKGKSETAPYWIGNEAYKILMKSDVVEELVFDQEE